LKLGLQFIYSVPQLLHCGMVVSELHRRLRQFRADFGELLSELLDDGVRLDLRQGGQIAVAGIAQVSLELNALALSLRLLTAQLCYLVTDGAAIMVDVGDAVSPLKIRQCAVRFL